VFSINRATIQQEERKTTPQGSFCRDHSIN